MACLHPCCERTTLLRLGQLGTCTLTLGSLALLVVQRVSLLTSTSNEEWQASNNGDDDTTKYYDETNRQHATATTATILCASVLLLALTSLMLQIRHTPEQDASNGYGYYNWNRLSRILLLAPSLALFLMLLIRLWMGADQFLGEPARLDFGWKYGLTPHDRSVENDGDALYNETAEKSIAFIVEFNSYAHGLQGFLAALLSFPILQLFFISCFPQRARKWMRNIVQVVPWFMTLYPTYSLVKRVAKALHAFAGSSFANNSFEWSAGFMVGLALGDLLSAAAALRIASSRASSPGDSADDGAQPFQELEMSSASTCCWKRQESSDKRTVSTAEPAEQEQQSRRWVQILQFVLGSLFVLTVIASAVLFGITWNGCLEGSPDVCINAMDQEEDYSPLITILFVAIPLVTIAGTGLYESRRGVSRESIS